ncbi:hypothetical protein V492_01038 [Pseudogymnoascus sp. VKM F-4246]|nr:hypothetical protein V492_01038 [Pseudogymnoascus sp. VKM F-4246]
MTNQSGHLANASCPEGGGMWYPSAALAEPTPTTPRMLLTVQLWDAAIGAALRTLNEHNTDIVEVIAIAFSPDGKQLASALDDSRVQFWEPDTGAMLHEVNRRDTLVFSSDRSCLQTNSGVIQVHLI